MIQLLTPGPRAKKQKEAKLATAVNKVKAKRGAKSSEGGPDKQQKGKSTKAAKKTSEKARVAGEADGPAQKN